MHDGVRLATDIYLPVRPRAFSDPAHAHALQQMCPGHAGVSGRFVVRGTRIRVPCPRPRGKGRSQGEPTAFVHEALDGYDTLEWASRQSWCNGRLGMWGESYPGFAQWRRSPPITPTPSDRAQKHVRSPRRAPVPPRSVPTQPRGDSGVRDLDRLQLVFDHGLGYRLERPAATRSPSRVLRRRAFSQPRRMGERLSRHWQPSAVWRASPVASQSDSHTAHGRLVGPLPPRTDDRLGPRPEHRVGCALPDHGRHGSWSHCLGTCTAQRRRSVAGLFADHERSAAQYLGDPLQFYDMVLKGDERRRPPTVRWRLTHGDWREAESWPPPGTQALRLYLAGGPSPSASCCGELSANPPSLTKRLSWVHDPRDLVPAPKRTRSLPWQARKMTADRTHAQTPWLSTPGRSRLRSTWPAR